MRWYHLLTAMLVMLALSGCNTDNKSNKKSAEQVIDTDGDGLSDADEINIWHTNPILADTDGDGWEDGKEATFGGNFSPLIANMPKIQLEVTTGPSISLNYTQTTGNAASKSIVTGTSVTQEESQSNSYAKTTSLQHGWSVESTVQAGVSVGTDTSVEGSWGLTLGYNGSYTSEDSYEWGATKTASNTQSVESAEEYETSESITYEGGTLSIGAKLLNPSDIAYTLKSMSVTAYAMDPAASGSYTPIGTMILDGGFSETTLSPGSETGEMVFTKTDLSVDLAKKLATNIPSLVFGLTSFSATITDEDTVSNDFTAEMTTVAALCAKVVIDDGAASTAAPKEYLVATRTKYNADYNTSDEIYDPVYLSDILSYIGLEKDTDYTVGSDGHIVTLSGTSEESTANSQWVLSVQKSDGSTTFYSKTEGYDLGAIVIEPGYRIDLFYTQDQDQDGLVRIVENLYGSSDTDTDSDNDTISDFDEVVGWDHDNNSSTLDVITNPMLNDTDGDTILDAVDPEPVSVYLYTSAEVAALSAKDYAGNTIVFDTNGTAFVTSAPVASQSALIRVFTKEPVQSVTLDGNSMTRDTTDPLLFTYEIPSLYLGSHDYTLAVTSEDGLTTTDTSLQIDSTLQDADNLTLTPVGLSSTGYSYEMDLAVNLNGYTDTRAAGALLLYVRGEPVDIQLEPTNQLPSTIKNDGDNPTTYSSDETAVKWWDVTTGTVSLASDIKGPFGASYCDQKYSFRVVMYGSNGSFFYYSPGKTVSKSHTTPIPTTITLDTIKTRITWEYTSNAEDDPEFVINENLENKDGDYLQDLATRSVDYPWKPKSDPIYESTYTIDEANNDFTVSSSDPSAKLFQIWYHITEDEPVGDHEITTSTRAVQLFEKADDGLYGLGTPPKYGDTVEIDTQTYTDDDKGDITMTWWVNFHTKSIQ